MKVVSAFLPPYVNSPQHPKDSRVEELKKVEHVESGQHKLSATSTVAHKTVNAPAPQEHMQHNKTSQHSKDKDTPNYLTEAEKQLILELRSRDNEARMRTRSLLQKKPDEHNTNTTSASSRFELKSSGTEVHRGIMPRWAEEIAQKGIMPKSFEAEGQKGIMPKSFEAEGQKGIMPKSFEAEGQKGIMPEWLDDHDFSSHGPALFDDSGQKFLDLIEQSMSQSYQDSDIHESSAQPIPTEPPKYPMGIKMMLDVQRMGGEGELIRQGGNLDIYS